MRILWHAAVVILLLSVRSIPVSAAVTGVAIDDDGAAVPACTVTAFAAESSSAQRERLTSSKPERVALGSTACSSGGAFSLAVTGARTFVIQVDANGFAPQGMIVSSDDETGAIMMTTAPSRIGHISAAGKPVANARAAFRGRLAEIVVTTDASGAFHVPDPSIWSGERFVLHPDFAPDLRRQSSMPLDGFLTAGRTLKVRVLQADGKSPAARAAIDVDGWTAGSTGDDGTIELHHVASSWAVLTARLDGQSAGATHGSTDEVTLRLSASSSVQGTVRDVAGKTPLAGAIVSFQPAQMVGRALARGRAGSGQTVVTDGHGRYHLEPIPPGSYETVVLYPRYESDRAPVVVAAGKSVTHDLSIVPGGQVAGMVVDEDKHPVAGAEVRMAARHPGMGPRAMLGGAVVAWTDPKGVFLARSVSPNVDLIPQAAKKGQLAAKGTSLKVAPGERHKGVVIVLSRGLELAGLVTDEAGKPVAHVTVRAVEDAGGRFGQFRMEENRNDALPATGANGKFSVRLTRATYDLTFRLAGYATQTVRGIRVPNDGDPIRIKLAKGATIQGRVQQSKTGLPIADAQIIVLEQSGPGPTIVNTAADGTFILSDLEAGPLQVEVRKVEENIRTMKKLTAPSVNVIVEIPKGESISGRVVSADGHPVTDFMAGTSTALRMGNQTRRMPAQLKPFSNSDGAFTIENVAPGTTDLVVAAPGYVEKRMGGLTVESGKGLHDLEVTIDQGTHVSGTVTGPDAAPLPGVSVQVLDSDASGPGTAGPGRGVSTDMAGAYSLDQLEPGEITLTFRKEGVPALKKTIKVEGKEQTVDVQMASGLALQGRVTTPDGAPAVDAEVSASSQSVQSHQTALTDASGVYRMTGLTDGRYNITASKSGFPSTIQRDVDLSTTGGSVDLVLQRGASIHGRLSGLTPQELQHAEVTAGSGRESKTATVASDGTYRLDGAPTGTVSVEASSFGMGSGGRAAPSRVIELIAGADEQVDFDFSSGSTIRGRVTSNGQPYPGAVVSFSSSDPAANGAFSSGHVDDSGAYEVKGLAAGTYRVSVRDTARFAVVFTDSHEVTSSANYDINVKATHVQGHVVDGDGNPLEGAVVTLQSQDASSAPYSRLSGLTSAAGDFTIEGAPDGPYKVVATKSRYETTTTTLSVSNGTSEPISLVMKSSDGFLVTAIDARNSAPLVVGVSVRDVAGARIYDRPPSNAAADTARVSIPPGSYRMYVWCSGYATRGLNINAPSNDLSVPMSAGGSLVIHSSASTRRLAVLIDAAGMIHFLNGYTLDGRFGVDPGTTTLDNVEPGSYTLRVFDSEGAVAGNTPVVISEENTTTTSI